MAIIFDTETTGFPKSMLRPLNEQPRIIEFAAIKINDKTLEEIDRIEFLCDPGIELSEKIIEITGLTNEKLIGESTFEHRISELRVFFDKEKYLIAHNINFDLKMLEIELKRNNLFRDFVFPVTNICTVNETFKFKDYRLTLKKLYNHLFSEDLKDAHRAMKDAEALTKCVRELVKRKIIVIEGDKE